MNTNTLRAMAMVLVAIVASVPAAAAFGQTDTFSSRAAEDSALQSTFSYQYDQELNWQLDANGCPLPRTSASTPGSLNSTAPGWISKAPVVPARRGDDPTSSDAVKPQGLASKDLANGSKTNMETRPDTKELTDKRLTSGSIQRVSGESETGFTESVMDAIHESTQAVVGSWNWLKLEAKEQWEDRAGSRDKESTQVGVQRRGLGLLRRRKQ